MSKLRIIVKVPHTTQTAHDSWQDTTHFKTFDVEMTEELSALFSEHRDATIAGVEPLLREGTRK